MTTTPPIQKCRCASKTHGHKPGKCTNLATEPESLCKPCYDKTSDELSDVRSKRLEPTGGIVATGLPNTDKLGLDVDTGAHPRIRPTSSRYLPHFFRLEGQLLQHPQCGQCQREKEHDEHDQGQLSVCVYGITIIAR